MLEKHGFDPAMAEQATRDLPRNVDRALNVYSRAVLGLNPDELGSPRAAALTSAVAFVAGALIPLLPWYLASHPVALGASLALSGLAALGIGGALGHLSNHRVVRSALRQLLIVALASAVTYLVGRLLGVVAA
jgi:VIT1/CCC1 family predicted Fe2+/Mn2+ transporter